MQCGLSGIYFWHFYDFENFWGFWAPKWSFAPKFWKIILTIYRLIKYETTKKNEKLPSKKGQIRYKAKSKFYFMSITMDAGSERASCDFYRKILLQYSDWTDVTYRSFEKYWLDYKDLFRNVYEMPVAPSLSFPTLKIAAHTMPFPVWREFSLDSTVDKTSNEIRHRKLTWNTA